MALGSPVGVASEIWAMNPEMWEVTRRISMRVDTQRHTSLLTVLGTSRDEDLAPAIAVSAREGGVAVVETVLCCTALFPQAGTATTKDPRLTVQIE